MLKKLPFIIKLFIITALSVLISLFLENQRDKKLFNEKIGTSLLPQLKIEEINTILLSNMHKQELILKKENNSSWIIANRWNYPANEIYIKKFLNSCKYAQIIMPIYIKNKVYYNYFLQRSENIGWTPDIDVVLSKDQQKLSNINIGLPIYDENKETSIGRYVSLNNDINSLFLVQETFDLCSTNPLSWIKHDFFNGFTAIKNLELSIQDKIMWKIQRQMNKTWQIFPQPNNGKKLNMEKLKQYSTALGNAIFSDIADPQLSSQETGLNHPFILKIEDNLGNILTYHFGKKNSQYGFYGKLIYQPIDPKNANDLKNWIFIFDPSVVSELLTQYSDFLK